MSRRPPGSPLFPYPELSRAHPVSLGPAANLRGAERAVDARHAVRDVAERGLDAGNVRDALPDGELAPVRRLVLRHRIGEALEDRKSTRLNSSHANISYAVFC